MIRILVANTGLPSKKIGSWTNRISRLIEANPDFFSFILSPTSTPTSSLIFCKKRKWIPFFPPKWKSWQVLNFEAGQFIQAFKKLPIHSHNVQVVVLDDMVLLEAFALLKSKGYVFELVFSFHGHSFSFTGPWAGQVDKVLFLTKIGYLETLHRHQEFTPEAAIVGNGVDSSEFFSISKAEKSARKTEMGYSSNSKILIWLSNNRPKKGLHLFEKLAKKLADKYEDLVILIIGVKSESKPNTSNIQYLGKLPNKDLPYFLQVGDFYAFTSLWKEGFGLSLAEAAKCGNRVIASHLGGIPEVVESLPGAILVDQPNVLEAWELAFAKAWQEQGTFRNDPELLSRFHDRDRWEQNFLAALQN